MHVRMSIVFYSLICEQEERCDDDSKEKVVATTQTNDDDAGYLEFSIPTLDT